MDALGNIYQKLNLSNSIQSLIFNKIKIPILNDYQPVDQYWYPHPPCLIPLFLDADASYTGILCHFFCDRKRTFIEYDLELNYFSEIARNENQLFTLMVLNMISVKDKLTPEIIEFCKQIKYDKVYEVDEYTDKYGTDLSNPSSLVYYNQHTPFVYIKNLSDYDGDFPSSLKILNPNQISNSCSYEIAEKQLLNSISNLPVWLNKNENKKVLFNNFIEKKQLREAWFTLNSSGWYLHDIVESLEIMKSLSDDELLQIVADNWINEWEKASSKNSYESYIL